MNRSKARKQITQTKEEMTVLKQEIGHIVNENRNSEFTIELVKEQLVQIEEKENAIVQLEIYIEELNELSRLAGLEVEEGTAIVSTNESQQPFAQENVEVEPGAPTTQQFTCPKCKQSYEEPKKCGHKMGG